MLNKTRWLESRPLKKNRFYCAHLALPLLLTPLMAIDAAAGMGNPDIHNLSFSGDARLRYENTSSLDNSVERNRGVMRARLKATYQFSEYLKLGARLTTGDADDPNSTDVTMSNFNDDLGLSLDQAYVEWRKDNMFLSGGKFSNPLVKTDLVWDGDVNPFGMVGNVQLLDSALDIGFTGIFAIIDEQTSLSDSYMSGAQITLSSQLNADWKLALSGAYYDYSIGSLQNANSGDTRDNYLTPDSSAYVSDFDLVDTILELHFTGLGERWPIKMTADFVRNLGAEVDEDTGVGLDLSVGRTKEIGDWKLNYGYTQNETDAVFTAFSHDNTTYASNYRQHTLSLDYVPMKNTTLNFTGYHYKRDQFIAGYSNNWDDYITRIRLNLSFSF